MNNLVRNSVLAGAILTAAVGLSLPSQAEDAPATAPATATAPAARPAPAVIADLKATSREVGKSMKPLKELLDPKVRATVAPAATPSLRKMVALLEELAVSNPDPAIFEQRDELRGILTFLGDAEARKALEAVAAGKDANMALDAKLEILTADWWINNTDAAQQGKILDQAEGLAKANPKNDNLAGALLTMSNLGAAKPELAKRARQIILTQLTSPTAQKLQAEPQMDAPLAVSGPTLDGGKINTADLKGKVVVIDFWATWCGPCVGEVPALIAMYQKNHPQGLEIVGVSADQTAEDLKKFLAEHKEMTWAQIYEDKTPLATRLGVEGYPTQFVIDRNGKLRGTFVGSDKAEQMEALVTKLLGEKADATQPGH